MLKQTGFYVLGVLCSLLFFVFLYVLLMSLFQLAGLFRDQYFMAFLGVYVVLVFVAIAVAVFYFWKRKRPVAVGVLTAPVVGPILLVVPIILYLKIYYFGLHDPGPVLAKLEEYRTAHGQYPGSLDDIDIKKARSQEFKYELKGSGYVYCHERIFFEVSPPPLCYDSQTRIWGAWIKNDLVYVEDLETFLKNEKEK